jgi:hypothetical protein
MDAQQAVYRVNGVFNDHDYDRYGWFVRVGEVVL